MKLPEHQEKASRWGWSKTYNIGESTLAIAA